MLGEVEDDLADAMGVDVIGINPASDMFGNPMKDWKEWRTPWDQVVMVPGSFAITVDDRGDSLIHPQGDATVAPSAKMPKAAYFFDAVNRQGPLDESKLDPEDNVEEFVPIGQEDLDYWSRAIPEAASKGKGLVANFGGTGIGDIALVPGLNLKAPKGIRDVADWYMSTLMRPDYLHYIFDKQTDVALENLALLKDIAGDLVDVVAIGSKAAKPPLSLLAHLAGASRWLVALDNDADEAAGWWGDYSARVRRVRPLQGNDLTDFHHGGGDLGAWIAFQMAALSANTTRARIEGKEVTAQRVESA